MEFHIGLDLYLWNENDQMYLLDSYKIKNKWKLVSFPSINYAKLLEK